MHAHIYKVDISQFESKSNYKCGLYLTLEELEFENDLYVCMIRISGCMHGYVHKHLSRLRSMKAYYHMKCTKSRVILTKIGRVDTCCIVDDYERIQIGELI